MSVSANAPIKWSFKTLFRKNDKDFNQKEQKSEKG
jgi:hypothetical protein